MKKLQGLSISSRSMADLMEAVVQRGVPFRFQARGNSMTPAIRDGDIITIAPLSMGEPRPGQVAACRIPDHGNLLVHRVLKRRAGRFLVRGDRVGRPDGWIPRTYLLGVVSAVERNGRRRKWYWKGFGAWLAFFCLVPLGARRLARTVVRSLRRSASPARDLGVMEGVDESR